MQINRVVLGCDTHPEYLPFWNLSSKAWRQVIGVIPTLVLIADEIPDYLDDTYGEIHLLKPIQGIPTARQAQIVRFFYPSQFPDEVCLTSDIDMFPLSSTYFNGLIKDVPEDNLAVYSADSTLPGMKNHPSFAVGYNAAKGKTFEEIVQGNMNNWEQKITEWVSEGHQWFTDEIMFYKSWSKWDKKDTNTSFFKRGYNKHPDPLYINRIDRGNGCKYDRTLLERGYYFDFHMPRPYKKYESTIHEIVNVSTNNKFFEE